MFLLRSDALLLWVVRAFAILAAAILALIAVFLVIESLPALRSVGPRRFFDDPFWHPAGGAEQGGFNLTPMIAGTLAAAAGAVVLAAPLGVASALFCRFYAPPTVSMLYRRLLELLAGIPSVVYGFWGLVVLAPVIGQWRAPGQNLLTGILILALMILPTIALLSEIGLRSVPRAYLLGAAALGLSRWATVRGVALPAARGAIVTAVVLAAARAMGETMAVLMVAGNVVQVPGGLLDPVRTLTANMALELGYAMDHHRSALFVSGLMLMTIVVVVVAMTERFAGEQPRG